MLKRTLLGLVGVLLSVSAADVLFEDALTSGLVNNAPKGWRPYKTVIQDKSGTVEAVKSGVRMVDDGPGEIGFFRIFNVKPGSWVRASAEVRAPKGMAANDAFGIQLTCRKAKPQQSKYQAMYVANGKYEPYSVVMKMPDGIEEVLLYIYSHKAKEGAIEIRNLKVETSDKAFKKASSNVVSATRSAQLLAVDAVLGKSVKVVDAKNAEGGKAVQFFGDKCKETSNPPDLTFTVNALENRLYAVYSRASVDAEGAALMAKTQSKYGSLQAKFLIDGNRLTERVVFVPWSKPEYNQQAIGKFWLKSGKNTIKMWLPEHVRLHEIVVQAYNPVKVPEAAQKYVPRLTPPPVHPRLWITPDLIPQCRANLETAENAPHWKVLKNSALLPYKFVFEPDGEVPYDDKVETAVRNKAFYYLMTGDKKIAEEASKLATDYISHVSFGNILDITREMGRAIFSVSCAYDWCYDVMTDAQRSEIRKHFERLRVDMECGWPPFGQNIVNGHGNEYQINRDLLSMSIAIYDEDKLPYQYCSYAILEQLVPMRKWEYQSSRHNQGVSYSSYRFGCDMHSTLLFSRMVGHEVFDPNIKNVPLYWLYMRTPNGAMLGDGDGCVSTPGRYWSWQSTAFLSYAYSGNPIVKGEFLRQNGASYVDHLYFLLMNRPEIKPEKSLDSLPLTHDFGPILSGMIARTGWSFGGISSDVVAEIKGGGYHFGNHLHADAGSFQVYYHGLLSAKLGEYVFYGTPYDMNFNKRSVSKSMLLVRDPKEKFLGTVANDGGSRFIQSHPTSPEQTMKEAIWNYGKKLSCAWGPSEMRPAYSYYAADLTKAYSEKLKQFTRRFCFLNMGDDKIPAVIVMADNVEAASPDFKKYWQVCSYEKPDITADGAVLHSTESGLKGNMFISMLRPAAAERDVECLVGLKEIHNVFGENFTPPRPGDREANGSRLMFSPKTPQKNNQFLTVMQVTNDGIKPLPVDFDEKNGIYMLAFADRFVAMPAGSKEIASGFDMVVKGQGTMQILVAGIAAGDWTVANGATEVYATVEAGKNTLFLTGKPGKYTLVSGKKPGAQKLVVDKKLEPAKVGEYKPGTVFVGGNILPGASLRTVGNSQIVSIVPLLKQIGVDFKADKSKLTVKLGDEKVVLTNGQKDFAYRKIKIPLDTPVVLDNGEWFVSCKFVAMCTRMLLKYDVGADVAVFMQTASTLNDKILWVDSNTNPDFGKLQEMLRDGDSKNGYWDGLGRDTWFSILLRKPVTIKGVGIQFIQGTARVAKFAIEVTDENGKVQTVFSGESSGKTNDMENYTFPPVKAASVRFLGKGNTVNNWNSIISFKLLE